MKILHIFRIAVLAAIVSTFAWAQDLKLPAIFSDNLVLQAGENTPVFGKAEPGASVKVIFTARGKTYNTSASADKDGKWLAMLKGLPSGVSGSLKIVCGNDTVTLKNALVGEVWICSGQSNMEFSIAAGPNSAPRIELAQKEAKAADGQIRMFRVQRLGADEPQDDVACVNKAGWEIITPENVRNCTAVGWNFAVRVNEATKQPVGLINTYWGGTPVEAWMSAQDIEKSGVSEAVWARHEQDLTNWEEKTALYNEALADFKEKYPTREEQIAHARERPREPYTPTYKNVPVRLYNAMVNGLMPYGARGILWYQGETNGGVPRAKEYGPLIRAMVNGWRERFNQPLWFYYVELANYMKAQSQPMEPKGWALIREGQAGALELPGTGVATAIDVGVANDIHPTDKKTVGNRLAGMALNDIYGHKSLCRSPQYASHEVKGDKVIIKLDYGEGLRSRTGKVEGFAIRGEDGEWVWAEKSRILADGSVEVSSAKVSAPVAVRYGWASNPIISLENEAGLPLRPFRTDKDSDL